MAAQGDPAVTSSQANAKPAALEGTSPSEKDQKTGRTAPWQQTMKVPRQGGWEKQSCGLPKAPFQRGDPQPGRISRIQSFFLRSKRLVP